MHIVIDSLGSVTLTEPEEFTAFDVIAADPTDATVLAALGERAGPAPDPGHVFMDLDAVRDLAGSVVDDAWEANLAGMVKYAAANGWVDEATGRVRAHIVAEAATE